MHLHDKTDVLSVGELFSHHKISHRALRCQLLPLYPLSPGITPAHRAQIQHRPFEWQNAALCISVIRGHPRG